MAPPGSMPFALSRASASTLVPLPSGPIASRLPPRSDEPVEGLRRAVKEYERLVEDAPERNQLLHPHPSATPPWTNPTSTRNEGSLSRWRFSSDPSDDSICSFTPLRASLSRYFSAVVRNTLFSGPAVIVM